MKCVRCGNELQPGARFCIYCGAPAAESMPVNEPAQTAGMPPVGEPEPAPVQPSTAEPEQKLEEQTTTEPSQATVEQTAPEQEPASAEPVAAESAQPQQQAYSQPAQPQQQTYSEPTQPQQQTYNAPTQPQQQTYGQPTQPQQQTYGQPTQPQQAYNQPMQQQQSAYNQSSAQYGNPYSTPVQPVPENPQKKGKKGIVALVVIVIVLLAALVAAVAAVFVLHGKSSGSTSNQLSYVKNGKVYYVKDIRKDDDAVVVCSIKNADDAYTAGTFTADGRYLYFYNKMESSTTGKLCRVEVSKLKADEDKNEDLIEELASGVMDYSLIDDDRFVYQNDSNELYYYDGEDKNKIATDVSYFYLSGDEKVSFATTSNEISTYSIADDETTTVIDNCTYIVASTADGYYYAVYDEDDYQYDLYYCTSEGDSEKIATDTYTILGAASDNNTVYYVQNRTENVCYYDLVNDIYADEDANITQPVATDYLTPCTEYDAMSDWDREYYSNYPDDIESFYYWLYEDYYYDTGMLYYYSYHVDESGNYIYSYYFYDETNTQWYAFDEDAYDAAVSAYNGVDDRISLREALKESTTDITYYDLYAWDPDNGQETVASDISPYSAALMGQTGIVVYQKFGEIGKVDWPEDAYGTWFVEDYIYNCRYGEDATGGYYYSCNGEEAEWNSEWGNLDDGTVSVYFDASPSGKYVMEFVYSYDDDYNTTSTMSVLSLEDGSLSMLDSDIAVTTSGIWMNDDYYYYEPESDSEGNLCCYSNGTASTVLKNISNAQVKHYVENGTYSAYADYDYSSGGTLKIFNEDGESTKIDSDVSSYCYISDDLIVYLRDGKLYVYRGEDKEKFKIDSSVTSFTCDEAYYESLLY